MLHEFVIPDVRASPPPINWPGVDSVVDPLVPPVPLMPLMPCLHRDDPHPTDDLARLDDFFRLVIAIPAACKSSPTTRTTWSPCWRWVPRRDGKRGARLIGGLLRRTSPMVHPTDPDEVRPTPRHLALLAVAVPKPRDALVSFGLESGLGLVEIALWVMDLRSALGTLVWQAAMDEDERRLAFIGSASTRGVPPVFCTATSLQGALLVLREWMPDLPVHVLGRPTGTVTIVLSDEHDDVRLHFVGPDTLDAEH